MHITWLWSDILVWLLTLSFVLLFLHIRKKTHWRDAGRRIVANSMGMVTLIIFGSYLILGLLDSIHWQTQNSNGIIAESVLDKIFQPLITQDEKTYSAPFAHTLLNDETINGKLRYTSHLYFNDPHKGHDILMRLLAGFSMGLVGTLFLHWLWLVYCRFHQQIPLAVWFKQVWCGETVIAWRAAWLTLLFLFLLIGTLVFLANGYHILGTDKIGRDVFYQAVKSIRTGLLIGTFTTLFMLPFALLFGLLAGYFSGWVDDIIQYLYTTLSSIPGVLLISAAILVLQVYISNHTELFPTLAARADARLLALCFILGVTSWAGLCRLLRAETLKLRELEFVQVAQTMGVTSWKILWRHILPNVMPIILITIVLDFSGLVLAEAVLSYVGVGVDPTTISWGNMINSSRLELARDPAVWWPLLAALIFMSGLVLSVNLLADVVRDALDPRLRGGQS